MKDVICVLNVTWNKIDLSTHAKDSFPILSSELKEELLFHSSTCSLVFYCFPFIHSQRWWRDLVANTYSRRRLSERSIAWALIFLPPSPIEPLTFLESILPSSKLEDSPFIHNEAVCIARAFQLEQNNNFGSEYNVPPRAHTRARTPMEVIAIKNEGNRLLGICIGA